MDTTTKPIEPTGAQLMAAIEAFDKFPGDKNINGVQAAALLAALRAALNAS